MLVGARGGSRREARPRDPPPSFLPAPRGRVASPRPRAGGAAGRGAPQPGVGVWGAVRARGCVLRVEGKAAVRSRAAAGGL